MKSSVYCVFDSAAGAFLPPMLFQSDNVAIRAFRAAATTPGHDFQRSGADYTLFRTGTFDDAIGNVINLTAHINLGNALQVGSAPTDPRQLDISCAASAQKIKGVS